ncbi:MAG: response regulator transcription factor [Lachnospiraceae bacterium]|nr:response regulator transcription factor [Lachnospiraceae bacterium]
MYNIGICDDGENTCYHIENILLQCATEKKIQIDTFVWYTGEGLKEYLERGNQLDILFLDIELFQMSGIEVGKFIRNQLDDMGMQIVYISGKASYAQQLFKTQPLDFLVKPVTKDRISDVLETASKVLRRKNEKFEFRQGKDYYYVPMGDIVYFVSEGRKVKIITTKETFEFYGRLKETAGRLSEDFVTIHKSYIVNKEYIFRYSYEAVELVNGIVLTISPANRKLVREKILRGD